MVPALGLLIITYGAVKTVVRALYIAPVTPSHFMSQPIRLLQIQYVTNRSRPLGPGHLGPAI